MVRIGTRVVSVLRGNRSCLRTISETKMPGLGDCGICEETEGGLEILKNGRYWDPVNRGLSLKL